jgi:TRAP-type C4-dicarboxylate transport system substrate-binding protein
MLRAAIAGLAICAAASPCFGQVTLRIATLAPDGTMWAHELHSWERMVEKDSLGAVRVKVYFDGVAGDELAVAERIRRGQLDGIISAGTLCQKVAPSLRVMKVLGLFQNRDEAAYVLNTLRPVFDKEAQAHGFVNLAVGGLGSIIIFSRNPVATMADLRRTTMWTGRQDDFTLAQLNALGLHAVPEPIEQAGAAFAAGRIDGFLTVPSVALAWQWSKQVHYFSDLRVSFLTSCLLISNASFDELSVEAQGAVRAAAAQALARLSELGHRQDEALVKGLFEQQGLKRVRVDEGFRSQFFVATRGARDRLSDDVVPAGLVTRVLSILADYRAARP